MGHGCQNMSLVGADTVFWLILAAGVTHVVEEYVAGWVDTVNEFHLPMRMTMRRFTVINILFLALCIWAALVNVGIPVLSLSIAMLVFINGLIHVMWTVRLKVYFPGAVSSILLYIPLSIYAYYLFAEAGLLNSPFDFALSILLGAGWMMMVAVIQLVCMRHSE